MIRDGYDPAITHAKLRIYGTPKHPPTDRREDLPEQMPIVRFIKQAPAKASRPIDLKAWIAAYRQRAAELGLLPKDAK